MRNFQPLQLLQASQNLSDRRTEDLVAAGRAIVDDPVRERMSIQNVCMALGLGLLTSEAIRQVLYGGDGPLGRREER